MLANYRPELLLINAVEAWQIAILIGFFGFYQIFQGKSDR